MDKKNKQRETYGLLRLTLGRSDLRVILLLIKQQPSVLIRHPFLLTVNLLLSCLLAPFKCYEKLRWHRRIRASYPFSDPLFILGHYRSGTTHLFNLLALDNRYAYINSIKAALPDIYITFDAVVRRCFSLLSSGSRPCDNMLVAADSAQEDEYAMTNRSPHSFLHVLSFPKNFRRYIEKYTLFSDIDADELAQWQRSYRYLLAKVSFTEGGRQLLVKNPEHTGRLPVIAEMFPAARYVHIVRNPYDVYVSSINLYKSMFQYTALQEISDAEIVELVISRYRKMMQSYIDNKSLIDAGRIVEIRFEDLERAPASQLRSVYIDLGIEIDSQFELTLASYLETVSDYRKNSYSLSAEEVERVNREWGFAFRHWGYPMLMPDDLAASAAT